MGDDELFTTAEDESDGEEGERCDGVACAPIEVPADEARPASLEERVPVNLGSPTPEEVRSWPRRVVKLDGVHRLFLHASRELLRADGAEQLTFAKFAEYLEAVERPEPQIDSRSTWGPRDSVTLKVAHYEDVGGVKHMRFDGSREWRFEIYNLVDSQPYFPKMVKRTLMGFPYEVLDGLKIRHIYIDFWVGANSLGPAGDLGSPNARPAVMSGGCNWPFWDTVADTAGESGLCVSYAALNRLWSEAATTRRLSDADIDARYRTSRQIRVVADSLYHEAGHLYQWHYDNAPELSREGREALTDNALWDEFRIGSGYASGEGSSQGAGEGFAEAFRYRMKGITAPNLPGDLGTRVNGRLDQAGLPVVRSVRDARAAIEAYVEAHPFNS